MVLVDDRQGWIQTQVSKRQERYRPSKQEAGNWKGVQETDDTGQARQSRKWKGKARCGRVRMERELLGAWQSDRYHR